MFFMPHQIYHSLSYVLIGPSGMHRQQRCLRKLAKFCRTVLYSATSWRAFRHSCIDWSTQLKNNIIAVWAFNLPSCSGIFFFFRQMARLRAVANGKPPPTFVSLTNLCTHFLFHSWMWIRKMQMATNNLMCSLPYCHGKAWKHQYRWPSMKKICM